MKSNTGRLEVIKAAAERRRQMNYERTGLLSVDVLPDEPIPAGSYLVHNHVEGRRSDLTATASAHGYKPSRTIW